MISWFKLTIDCQGRRGVAPAPASDPGVIYRPTMLGAAQDIICKTVFLQPTHTLYIRVFYAVFSHTLWLSAGLVKSDPSASRN